MTIVELLDEKPINNVIGALEFRPDKLVYVGNLSENTFARKKLPVLKNFFREKSMENIEIEYRNVSKESLAGMIKTLEDIYEQNCDCKFHVEITGGDDLLLVALGVLCQRHPSIELYRFSSRLRNLRPFTLEGDGKNRAITCSNSVEENLILHGASAVSSNGSNVVENGFRFDLAFIGDVGSMWEVCSRGIGKNADDFAPKKWNKITNMLAALECAAADRDGDHCFRVSKKYMEYFKRENDVFLLGEYLIELEFRKLVSVSEDDEYLTYDFKNAQVKECLTKAGTILELKTFLVCCQLLGQGKGDCRTGVTIDWDGKEDLAAEHKFLYDQDDPTSTVDTINEVDVMATYGLIPYFISCKNGSFTAEELYKLYVVGEIFGRGYGKKIIVATDMDRALGDSCLAIRQRAQDMGITIISDVHRMDDSELETVLAKAMEISKK